MKLSHYWSAPSLSLRYLAARWSQRGLARLPRGNHVILVNGHAQEGDPTHAITDICRFRVRAAQKIAGQISPLAVMFTGWGGPGGCISEAAQMRRAWLSNDPDCVTSLHVEERSRLTTDNALFTSQLIMQLDKVEHIIIPTSYWHLRRIKDIFSQIYEPLGITVHTPLIWPSQLSPRQILTNIPLLYHDIKGSKKHPSILNGLMNICAWVKNHPTTRKS